MAKSLLLDVEKQELREVECSNFGNYYKYLDCKCIDIKEVFIINREKKSGIWIDVIFDNEFNNETLLKEKEKVPSALLLKDKKFEPHLFGNLIFTKHNDKGEFIDLTEFQLDFCKSCIEQIPFEIINEQTKLDITMHCKMCIISLDDKV